MKRVLAFISAVCVFLCVNPALFVFAAEPGSGVNPQPSNVTITVVMPETAPAPDLDSPEAAELAVPAFVNVYPSDVTEIYEGGVRRIIKIYELNAAEKPEDIPRDSFERGGWKFTLTDILRKETTTAETRDHTETVTVNTDTKELEKILPLLDPTMEYTAEDGFVGILSLDVASIKVETAGTKTTFYEMKVTREYPRLSANDTSLVPKTVTDNGKTYTLAGVDWKAGNYETIDYEQVPEYYTAVASYTATGTSTKVTGYVTTAVYNGTLAKLTQGKTVYTAYFEGEETRTSLEMTEPLPTESATAEPIAGTTSELTATPTAEATAIPTEETTEISAAQEPIAEPPETPTTDDETNHSNNGLFVLIPILAVAAAGVLYYIFKYKKGKVIPNEKTDNPAPVADDDGGDDAPGSRG
jgi:hypothetical protein